MSLIIKQGDQYKLPIALRLDEQLVTDDTIYAIETVEFYLADNLMEYKADGSGTVMFENDSFLLPLTQKMTFALRAAPVPLDVRVKFTDGDVIGLENKIEVTIKESRSRREL